MNKLNLYRIYCVTEGAHVNAYADAAITACPNDAEHEVRADSVCQLPAAGSNDFLQRVSESAADDAQRERVLAFLDAHGSFSCCVNQGCYDWAKEKLAAGVADGSLEEGDKTYIEGLMP